MIYSAARQFIFVHNPKVAGTAVREALLQYHDHPRTFWHPQVAEHWGIELDFAHLRLWEVAVECPDIIRSFVTFRSAMLVRDPVSRFIAAVFEHFAAHRAFAHLTEQLPERQAEIIDRFLPEITPARVLGDHRYVHFSPQRWFSHLGREQIVRRLVPVEHAADIFDALDVPPVPLPHRNGRSPPDWAALVTPKLQAFVAERYGADYELMA
jgi:hypothetical protein